jgi:hypothetical protein
MIEVAILAVIGGFLFWQCRDDDLERLGPLTLGSGTWKVVIMAAFLALAIESATVEWWRIAVAVALFTFVLTAAHNLLLSPASTQVLTKPRDAIQRFLFLVFDKTPGDVIGHGLYWTYSIVRYALPISGIGLCLNNAAMVVAGPLASLAYYPWVHSERSKYVRAAALGALVFGSMGWAL